MTDQMIIATICSLTATPTFIITALLSIMDDNNSDRANALLGISIFMVLAAVASLCLNIYYCMP